MYAGRVTSCPSAPVSHVQYVPVGKKMAQTDRRTDAKPMHYAYRWTRPAQFNEQKSVGLLFSGNKLRYDMVRQDIFTCEQTLTKSQHNLAYGTKKTENVSKN